MKYFRIYMVFHIQQQAKQKTSKATNKKMARYEVEILPNGVWRNPNPDYVIFSDHNEAGEHACPNCKCSFCQAPSIYNIIHATHPTDGRKAGLMYCLGCIKVEYTKEQKKAHINKLMKEQAEIKAEQAKLEVQEAQ